MRPFPTGATLSVTVVALLACFSSGRLAAQEAQDTSAVRLATSAASTWLALVDQGKYEQSWDAAAPAFQAAITKLAWIQALTQALGRSSPSGPGRFLAPSMPPPSPTPPRAHTW
jgi:hypothetical protein